MSRQPAPSVFSADALRFDVPTPAKADAGTVGVAAPVAEQPRKVGRPPSKTQRAKPTPFYLHPAVKDALRDICYHERRKEHDLFLEGLEHVLKVRAYPTIAEIVAKAEGE